MQRANTALCIINILNVILNYLCHLLQTFHHGEHEQR